MSYEYEDDYNDWMKEQEAMDYEDRAAKMGLMLPDCYIISSRARSLTYQQPE